MSKPIEIQVKPDGQVWILFRAAKGREAVVNLNNIVLDMPEGGITRGICMDALTRAIINDNQENV